MTSKGFQLMISVLQHKDVFLLDSVHTCEQPCFGVNLVFIFLFRSAACVCQVSGIDCWDPGKGGV